MTRGQARMEAKRLACAIPTPAGWMSRWDRPYERVLVRRGPGPEDVLLIVMSVMATGSSGLVCVRAPGIEIKAYAEEAGAALDHVLAWLRLTGEIAEDSPGERAG